MISFTFASVDGRFQTESTGDMFERIYRYGSCLKVRCKKAVKSILLDVVRRVRESLFWFHGNEKREKLFRD